MVRERVLVIDSQPAALNSMTDSLRRLGYDAVSVPSVETALVLLQKSTFAHAAEASPAAAPDLVLANLISSVAGGLNGLDLVDRLVAHYPGVPAVLYSAANDIHSATGAFRRGAVDYLAKPFTLSQLEASVFRAIELGRHRRHQLAHTLHLEEMVEARTGCLQAAMRDLEQSYDITLEAMGDALDLRDAETEGHSKRVTAFTIALAQSMGVGAEDLRTIARGAFLHDIGKLAVPDSILLKPDRLTPEEVLIMREHCERGYQIVRKIPFLRDASEIVYTHQESFDGSGYPRGLRKEEIPLGSRIFAVADTVDAITSDRPYRKSQSFAVARDEIVRCAGTQFDPVVVDHFLKLPADLWSGLRAEVANLTPEAQPARLYNPAA